MSNKCHAGGLSSRTSSSSGGLGIPEHCPRRTGVQDALHVGEGGFWAEPDGEELDDLETVGPEATGESATDRPASAPTKPSQSCPQQHVGVSPSLGFFFGLYSLVS